MRPLLALPITPVDESGALEYQERALLKRAVLLGELQRLQNSKRPSGLPELGEWQIHPIVTRYWCGLNVQEQIVWYVKQPDGLGIAYDKSGGVLNIATDEDKNKARWTTCAFLLLFFGTLIGTGVAIFVVVMNNNKGEEALIASQDS